MKFKNGFDLEPVFTSVYTCLFGKFCCILRKKYLPGDSPPAYFFPCLQQNYARKSTYISCEDRFLLSRCLCGSCFCCGSITIVFCRMLGLTMLFSRSSGCRCGTAVFIGSLCRFAAVLCALITNRSIAGLPVASSGGGAVRTSDLAAFGTNLTFHYAAVFRIFRTGVHLVGIFTDDVLPDLCRLDVVVFQFCTFLVAEPYAADEIFTKVRSFQSCVVPVLPATCLCSSFAF